MALPVLAHAQGQLISGSALRVVETTPRDAVPSIQIEFIRIIDDATFEVGILNNDARPVSVVATLVLYDITGTAFFVNGGLHAAAAGELISQAEPGRSEQSTRCFNILDESDGQFGGGYSCAKKSNFDLSDAKSALVVVSNVFVDDADRD